MPERLECEVYLSLSWWLTVLGQYREAATDLQHAVSLLREIYTTQLVHHETVSSSIFSGPDDYDDVDRHGVVAAVGSLIDTVALIGDELAERTHIERPSSAGRTNLSAGNVSAAVVARPPDGKRYSHADDLFQAAHIFHFCSIIILGVFVIEVRNHCVPRMPDVATCTSVGYVQPPLPTNKFKQVYRRRYESRRSSKPKLH